MGDRRRQLSRRACCQAALVVVAFVASVVMMSATGAHGAITFLKTWGQTGSGDSQFNLPWGVVITPTGDVCVVDNGNHRVQKWFDLDGWVAGAPRLDAAAIGPSQLLGAAVTLDATKGLLSDGALVVQPSGSLSIGAGATVTGAALQVSGGTISGDGPTAILNASFQYTSGSQNWGPGAVFQIGGGDASNPQMAGDDVPVLLPEPAALLLLASAALWLIAQKVVCL